MFESASDDDQGNEGDWLEYMEFGVCMYGHRDCGGLKNSNRPDGKKGDHMRLDEPNLVI